jgi:aspartyl-tRNA(Asn)/glutamyl-tRNA(Gln) amidotransferase subunit A
MDLTTTSLSALHRLLTARRISSEELTQTFLARIEATEPTINAFITQTPEVALAAARAADERIARGEATPLTGIPVAIKDILLTAGVRTTCASKMLSSFVPPYDATAWNRMKAQGAVLLGKVNQDEFAMGSSSESSAFGPTRNPWNPDYIPGGSSGGSAAAVAAAQAVASLGTDTGGSIRQPASHCGCVGLKPTYGRVSRYGVIAYASSLDQVGPLTRTVEDAAIILETIAGHDPKDATSVDCPVPRYSTTLDSPIKGMRIGLPVEYQGTGLDDDVRQALEAAIKSFEALGATLVPVSLPHTPYAVACYYLIATAEASSNLARYDGIRFGHRTANPQGLADLISRSRAEGFGSEVKRRIMLGTYALSSGYYDAYYGKAQKVRTLIREDFTTAFASVDLLLTPIAPTPAFRIGEKTADPLQMYLSDIFTIPVNLAGLCGISLPAGISRQGLPIGMQLIGPAFGEETLLKAAHQFERHTPWHQEKAPL